MRVPDAVVPYAMVLLFIVVMYGAIGETYPVLAPVRPAITVGVLALGSLLVQCMVSGRPFYVPWPEGHALLAFFGAAALSVPNALWPGLATLGVIDLAKALVFYFLVVNVVTTRARLRGLIWTLVLAGSFPTAGVIRNYLSGNLIEGRAAWVGKFAGANDVALELAILIPLALALTVNAGWKRKLVLGGLVAGYGSAIFFTYSRSGLLATGAIFALGFFRVRQHATRAIIMACVLAVIPFGMQNWERDQGFENLEQDVTIRSRLLSMRAGLAMFQSNPLFGIGVTCSFLGWEEFAPDTDADVSGIYMIHNTFVQVLAETGLVGFTLLMVAVLVALLRVRKLDSNDSREHRELRAYGIAIELSIVAFLVSSLANGFAWIDAPYLLIALASATRRVARDDKERENFGPR